MEDTIKQLLALGKGLLAADESDHTIEKRFTALGIESNPEMHRQYRQMLFTAPGIEEFLGGVILFDETVKQNTDDGVAFPDYLAKRGIVPGIKVDRGLEPYGETEQQVTKDNEGLDGRYKEYAKSGLKFGKWRASILISDIFPTPDFLEMDLDRMTEYAKISQDNGIVPVVEPEILLNGKHTTTRCAEISVNVWQLLFEKLKAANVDLKNLILKTNMILPGVDSGVHAEPLEVAEATLRSLKKAVPAEVGGVVFLSGGQTPDEATMNLNEIIIRKGDAPWPISFSYSRALQNEPMETWAGKPENVTKAQEVFLARLKKVSHASKGELI